MLRSPAVGRSAPQQRRTSITEVVVAVPMRNEASRAADCLVSLGQAIQTLRTDIAPGLPSGRPANQTAGGASSAGQLGPRVHTVVVLDSCTDQTAAVVADFPWVRAIQVDVGRVGAARSVAVRHGLGLTSAPPANTWIVNTDADSRVPRDWLTHQLSLAGLGADLVCGLVDPDPSECGPTRYAAWLAAYRRVDGHPHVHGANLGLRADCYLDCGGFTAGRRAHEDLALVRAAEARGWNVVASRGATVRTSGRVEGRVPAGGFAGYLRSCVPTPGTDSVAALEASA